MPGLFLNDVVLQIAEMTYFISDCGISQAAFDMKKKRLLTDRSYVKSVRELKTVWIFIFS